MATVVERLPIEPLYLWAALTGLIGFSVSVISAMSLLSGDDRTFNWLMIIAGVSMMFGTVWEAYHRDPAEFSMSGYRLAFLVVCAVVAVGATLLQIITLA